MNPRPAILLLLTLAISAPGQQPTSEKALERYRQMLEKTPAEGTALDRLWQSSLDAGRTTELIERYRAAGTFSSEMVLGLLLRKSGDLEGSATAFGRAAALEPTNALPLFALARTHTAANHHPEAAAVLQQVLTLLPAEDPRRVEPLLQLGSAWLAAGDLTQASEAWESAVTLNPADLDLRRRLAENYARNSLPARAIPHLEHLAAQAPPAERALAWQQLARAHQAAGHQDDAIRALDAALALTAPDNWLRAELQSQLIRLHQRYHRVDELEARWKKLATDDPRDLGAHLQLVDLYERLGQHEDERQWLEKLVALLPRTLPPRHKLARLAVQMDRLDEAAALYDQLLAAQPANADYVFERAALDAQREATEAARTRIAALLVATKNDETLRARALEFYEHHHLLDLVERHLTEDAASGSPEALTPLARFYFAQRRDADALAALARLVPASGSSPDQAAAHLQIARLLRSEHQMPAALAAAQRAVALTPEAREAQLQLGELLVASGERPAAQAALEKAVALSTTPEESLEAEQQLFDTLRQQALLPTPGSLPAGRAADSDQSPNLALQKYLASLQGRATTAASEEDWLRLARWQGWAGDSKPALASAQKALAVAPTSIAVHEFLIRQQIADGTLPEAVTSLTRLAEIDPAHRADYQRRAGQLELQAGRVAEALVIFQELTTARPSDIDALTDLALALQRGDRWAEARDLWRRIYALSPIARKKEALGRLLRTLERLDERGQAVDLMFTAIETEPDEREQFAQFADLLAFCTKHDLLDVLHTKFERRRATRADDYFTEMALGRILKASGNKAAAFEVLSDASYAAPDQAESLPELIREAEELRKLDDAVQLQAQFVRIARPPQPEHLEKLARLQERAFDLDDAARTWDQLVSKYPRDAGVLQRAVEFQTKWGNPTRALELLRRLHALEPANLQALSTLAELAVANGGSDEAVRLLEDLIRLTPPESASDPLRVPDLKTEDAAQLQLGFRAVLRQRGARPELPLAPVAAGWTGDSGPTPGDRELRLDALRRYGQLLQARGDRAALEAWIARWRDHPGGPNETLWALYFAGAGPATLDHLERLSAADPTDSALKNAFTWLGLQTGQFARLGTWMNARERSAAERDFLLVALDRYLQTHGRKLDPTLVPGLFAQASQNRLWDAAKVFEKRARLREAAALGQRVFDAVSTQRAPYGADLARWYLRLGDTARARRILEQSAQTTADSFDAPVYAALRATWLLLAPADRPAFTESYLRGLDATTHPLHRAIAGVLLHGLAGTEAAARADLERLASLGAMANVNSDDSVTSGARRWAFLLSAGLRLSKWKLEPLAATLWERALADDALIALEGEPALEIAREVRRRLQALRIMATNSPEAARESIEAFARVSSRDSLVLLGETLDQAGDDAHAVLVYRQLWEEDPGNAQLLRALLAACRAARDIDTAELAFTRLVEGGLLRGNEVAQQENLLQLADFLDSEERGERARVLLTSAAAQSPRDSRLALRLAQLCERHGHPAEAIATYRRVLLAEPRNFAAQLALAATLEQQGDLAGALQILQKSTSSEGEARLAQLRARRGETDEALASLDRLPAPQNVWPSIHVAQAIAAGGQPKLARTVLQTALDRNADPRMRFPLQSKVVEMLTPDSGEAAILRELRRLRQLSGEQPELLSSYFEFAKEQSARLGVTKPFQEELRAGWEDGAGPAAAGLTLLAAQLEARDPAVPATLARLLARDDLGETWLGRIAEAVRTAQRPELAAPVYAELAALNPANQEHVIDGARALYQAGRLPEAHALLGRLEALAVLDDELAGRLATAYAACGAPDRARLFFQQAMRADPLARQPGTYLACARIQSAAGEHDAARRTLRVAFANPATSDFDAILDWLAAAGRTAEFSTELKDFGLTPVRLIRTTRALLERSLKAGDFALLAAVLDFRPEVLEPGTAARLRTAAETARSFAPLTAALEKILLLPTAPDDLPGELALLYAAWAEAELDAANLAPALAHLQRGHAIQPGHFKVAFRLATILAERSDRAGAIATLDAFLAASQDPTDTARARTFLTQLKSGTRP